jgi:hypothetical protein
VISAVEIIGVFHHQGEVLIIVDIAADFVVVFKPLFNVDVAIFAPLPVNDAILCF